jgi:hypothetical protein
MHFSLSQRLNRLLGTKPITLNKNIKKTIKLSKNNTAVPKMIKMSATEKTTKRIGSKKKYRNENPIVQRMVNFQLK